MWLLVGTRPDVDHAVMEKASLVAERTVMGRPRLDNQIERLPMPLVHSHGIAVTGGYLPRHAADEPRLDSSLGQHIGERHFLGDPYRLASVRDWIAQDEEPGLAREASQRRQQQGRARINAGRSLVVFVEHDVHAHFLGELPLRNEPIVKFGSFLGVVITIWERDPDRLVLFRGRQIVIGVFAEVPGFHRVYSLQSLRVQEFKNGGDEHVGLLELRQMAGLSNCRRTSTGY